MKGTERSIDARLSVVVRDADGAFSLEIEFVGDGVVVLFGPSGAGKTVTLRALAGLVPVASGHVRVGSTTLLDTTQGIATPTHLRRLGYVPQHQSLFPFLNVAENVAFGLPRSSRHTERVPELLAEVGIAHLASASTVSLSGGERQRVAVARCLAVDPRLLLLDEPFASINHEGRASLREVVRSVIERRAIPAVLVTHDPEEAHALGDRVVRFARGKSVEQGTPREVLGPRAGAP